MFINPGDALIVAETTVRYAAQLSNGMYLEIAKHDVDTTFGRYVFRDPYRVHTCLISESLLGVYGYRPLPTLMPIRVDEVVLRKFHQV